VELEAAELVPPPPLVELALALVLALVLDPPPLPLSNVKHLPCDGGMAGASHVGSGAPASSPPIQTPTVAPLQPCSVLSHLPGAQSPSSQQYRAHFVAPLYWHVFPGLQNGPLFELEQASQVSCVPGVSEQM
jgi:hypothetical protein